MNTSSPLPGSLKKCLLVLEVATIGAMAAGRAQADCGVYALPGAPQIQWDSPVANTGVLPAVIRRGAEELIRAASEKDEANSGIVGMWTISFVSDGTAHPAPIPAGVEIDFGTVQWSSDGTEIMISGGRPPSSGNVCMGVWKRTGPSTYELRHVGLSWASADTPPPIGPVSPAVFVGPAVIQEVIVLNHAGNSYSGPFTIDQYAADGTTLLEHIGGTAKGVRYTVE